MPTKRFQAETMMEALEMVQKELGSDAIVLSSREVPLGQPWQVWRKPGIEVIAMAPDRKNGNGQKATQKQAPVIKKSTASGGVEWQEGREQIEWVRGEQQSQERPRQAAYPYNQTETQTQVQPRTTSQPQVQKRSSEMESSYLQRQKAAMKTTAQTEDSVVLPAEKPAVSVVPRVQNPAQKPAAAEQEARNAAKIPEGLAQTKLRLLAQGVDASVVDRIVQTTLTAFSPAVLSDEARSMTLVRKQLEAGLKVDENFLGTIPGNVVCLVGASGSGKTTTISKLAVHFSKAMGKKVTWICADTVRAGAIAETRAYADAIGVPLKLVYTPEDLTNTIKSSQDADILLIDTPGYNPCDEEQMMELGVMLTQLPERSTYLVAPATTKEADLLQAVASLGLFKIRGLIITKMDETYSFGSVYNFVHQSQLPMTLFSYGKQILGDLKQADAGKVVSALFGKGWK